MRWNVLAVVNGSDPVLRYVQRPLAGVADEVTVVRMAESELSRQQAYERVQVEAAAERLRKLGFSVHTAVLAGEPGPRIAAYAVRHGSDLVVLSAPGIAEELLRFCPVPVLAVGRTTPTSRIRCLLLPLDGSSRSELVLRPVIELARAHYARVLLLTVLPLRQSREQAAESLAEVQSALAAQRIPTEVAFRTGAPARAILAHALEERADLIAIATHGHGGDARLACGHVADEILHRSTLPVLLQRSVGVASVPHAALVR